MKSLLINEIIKSDRPRERLIKYGAKNLSNEELLSIILRTGTKNLSVKDLSRQILSDVKNISNLKNISLNRLKNIKGMGEVKAVTLFASIELGRRVYKKEKENVILLNTASKIYEFMINKLYDKKQECFYALYLDSKKKLITYKLLFKGTLNKSLVHPREIFKNAYLASASTIVCVHNHPSGDVLPSKEDLILTENLVKIGLIQGINVIDHIIVGNDNYYSFYENGDI